jgi:hypothetical protein
MTYGFIITRHVNSEVTNKYWNQCVKLIRTHYPFRKIIVIDDNSNQTFVKADHDYKNTEFIQSEYPKRGELLPYIYFLKHQWFDNAIILHDSVFIHQRIPFEKIKYPVMPLWHHTYDKEYLDNLLRICNYLKNNFYLKQKIQGPGINILGMPTDDKFDLCFGAMTYINLNFLKNIEKKYNFSNLVNCITSRKDRCGLERIIGLLFFQEYPNLQKIGSLFGNIHGHYKSFNYNYDQYLQDFQNKRAYEKFVKVWTGR